MKRISLILFIASMIWIVQTAQAQTSDTTKNHVEVKKKVRKGAHGRTITKIKMTGKGTPGAIDGAADGAVTGHLQPSPAPPPLVVHDTVHTEAPPPTVVVLHDTVRTIAPVVTPAPTTTEVTTTTETKPAVAATVTTRRATRISPAYRKPVHTHHKIYHKTTSATPATKTTTTTTVKKTE
jgi:hypothetical protein